MAVSRPQLQQRIPFVDGQGRLSNEGLRALNDALGSLFTQIQQIAELYGITDALNSDLAALASSGVVLATPGGFGAGRVLSDSSTINIVDGGPGDTITAHFSGSTSDVPEGSRLYFTNDRARSALSGGAGISYSPVTGEIAVNSTLAAYAGGDMPSAFTLSIVDSADAAAWRTAISAVPTSRSISTGTGLVGGGNLTADRTLSLATSGVTAGSYGSATKVPTLTVDTYGRVTIASENTIPALSSGTYTPTLTNISNLDGSTAYACQYQQVGDTVTVSGRIDVDPTALSASTVVDISLPIVGTNFTADSQAGGSGAVGGVQQSARIAALVGGTVARLSFLSTDTNNRPMNFCFMYRIMP